MKKQQRPFEDKREMRRTLREETRFLASDAVRYRLLEAPSQFWVEIVFGEERCLLLLGERFSDALLTFEMLVRGLVTPCSAPYILEDLSG